jgi:hypothetical protein
LGAVAASTSALGGKADTLAGREPPQPLASKSDSRISADLCGIFDSIFQLLFCVGRCGVVLNPLAVGFLTRGAIPLERGVDGLLGFEPFAVPAIGSALAVGKPGNGEDDEQDRADANELLRQGETRRKADA